MSPLPESCFWRIGSFSGPDRAREKQFFTDRLICVYIPCYWDNSESSEVKAMQSADISIKVLTDIMVMVEIFKLHLDGESYSILLE